MAHSHDASSSSDSDEETAGNTAGGGRKRKHGESGDKPTEEVRKT